MQVFQADLEKSRDFIYALFKRNASLEARGWLDEKQKQVEEDNSGKYLYLAFSAAPRFAGKKVLQLEPADLANANELRPGFDPSVWTTAQTARTLLLLSIPHQDQPVFLHKLNQLFATAEMSELVALYASLPLLPYPEAYKLRAAEGIRTNMGTVFEAIALNNPYSADYLEEGAWNQMVLKTVFVGKPLYRIYGLEKRSNPTLARILSDYAHERWAAGRTVTPELWRPVGPFLDEVLLEDIKKVFSHPDQIQQEAAALACAQGSLTQSKELLDAHPILKNKIETGELNWHYIGSNSLPAN
ncbi:EboA domain-containing protein [Pontibacter sp. BT731]|uniref:EboA domain-containing protein n=1 Tax=Pontibacter coccineus TaxID=3063328 RepID=UPI0026E2C64D|nr:EboA domain-containing protein [Pontibacter sp. BT731]MDO6388512.1 EboA domain-containing protein [Pontibacter sp. BT731]